MLLGGIHSVLLFVGLGTWGISIPAHAAPENLVQNPSFEELSPYIDFTLNAIERNKVPFWHGFSTDLHGSNIGSSMLTNTMPAHTGEHYAGFIALQRVNPTWSDAGYREYMHNQLKEKLNAGVFYKTSAFFSRPPFDTQSIAVQGVGFGFASSRPIDTYSALNSFGPTTPVNVAAATLNPILSQSWTEIKNESYLAIGNETYLTIGWMNTQNPVPTNLIVPTQFNNMLSDYTVVDDVNVSCSSSAGFSVNGQTTHEVTLECGDTLHLRNSAGTFNMSTDRWIIESLDDNFNPIDEERLVSEYSRHASALQAAGETVVPILEILPEASVLVNKGRHMRITRIGFCQNDQDTSQHSVVIVNKNYPSWVETNPPHYTLPMLVHANDSVRFELKYKRETPVSVTWNFDHVDAQTVAFGASRTWNIYGIYQNEAVVSYADGCVIRHPLPMRALIETSFIPKAFTPNGDGVNDFFLPKNSDVILIRTQIYDRDGHLISESTDSSKGWDGNFSNGAPAPQGVYIYRMELRWLTDRSGGVSDIKQGTVTLIR